MEWFYSIEQLSTERLKELFSAYRDNGWVDFEFHELMHGVTPTPLPDEEILCNINIANPHNYFVYMEDHEDEQDGVMIGFGLTNYPSFSAYLHLDKSLRDEIVEKYALTEKETDVRYTLWNNDGAMIN